MRSDRIGFPKKFKNILDGLFVNIYLQPNNGFAKARSFKLNAKVIEVFLLLLLHASLLHEKFFNLLFFWWRFLVSEDHFLWKLCADKKLKERSNRNESFYWMKPPHWLQPASHFLLAYSLPSPHPTPHPHFILACFLPPSPLFHPLTSFFPLGRWLVLQMLATCYCCLRLNRRLNRKDKESWRHNTIKKSKTNNAHKIENGLKNKKQRLGRRMIKEKRHHMLLPFEKNLLLWKAKKNAKQISHIQASLLV